MTNDANQPHRPRLAPDRPLPPYAYVPGRNPHPTRDPRGHSYGKEPETPEPPDSRYWRACDAYLYGIDLFNHGFYWEAHEAWEGLWVACGRRGPMGGFLKGLIALAAAGLKVRVGNLRGATGHAERAAGIFRETAVQIGSDNRHYMGLDLQALGRWASNVAERPSVALSCGSGAGGGVFDFVLSPEKEATRAPIY